MKRFILLVLLCAGITYAQDLGGDGTYRANKAQLFKTYTNYLSTSDDTSSTITIVPPLSANLMLAREVRLLAVWTDSCAADVYVIGTNEHVTGITTTYTDSIVSTSNTGSFKVITLKGPSTDQLAGCTQVKVGTVFRATGNGFTAGRSLKWYVQWVK